MSNTRHRFPWNNSELENLYREYNLRELTIQEISELHGRSVCSILHKLQKENLINDKWNDVKGWDHSEYYDDVQEKLEQKEDSVDQDSVEEDSVEPDSVEEDSDEPDSDEQDSVEQDSVEEDSDEQDSVDQDSVEEDSNVEITQVFDNSNDDTYNLEIDNIQQAIIFLFYLFNIIRIFFTPFFIQTPPKGT